MALPVLVAMAAFQVVNGLQQASSIRRQARLQERINEMNAKYIEQDAWEAEKFGFTQSARYEGQVDSVISEQRVGMAAQNIDITSGTAKEIQTESKLTGFLNTLDLQRAARAKALGLKFQASNVRLGSDMGNIQASAEAQSAQTSGFLQAGQTMLSGYGRG